ncbi:MAG: 50S ribosomal protein L10 [Candidatus Falkowbacteria bacterium]
MPKNKIQKQEILRNLSEKFKKSKSVVFAGFNALTVKDNEKLREQLRSENSEYYVAKKTLMNIAFKDQIDELNVRSLDGKLAAIFSYGDEVAAAKILGNFRKDKDKEARVFFLGGILENKLLSKSEIEAVSQLPSKHELYARLVGTMNAPISGFVNALAGNIKNLVYVLKAIEEKKA